MVNIAFEKQLTLSQSPLVLSLFFIEKKSIKIFIFIFFHFQLRFLNQNFLELVKICEIYPKHSVFKLDLDIELEGERRKLKQGYSDLV